MYEEHNNEWYINLNIKKYKNIDDVLDIIKLVDKYMIGIENISSLENVFGGIEFIKIYKSDNPQFDYICKTIKNYSKTIILQYIYDRFEQIEEKIKFFNESFGHDWYIDFKIFNLDINLDLNIDSNIDFDMCVDIDNLII